MDWNFAIADKDLDYLAAGETLTVNYNVKVSDATTSSTQTVSVVITGANDAPTITSGPESASLAEQAGVTGSTSLDSTSPSPTGTLSFTDVDLSDTHSVSVAVDSIVWSTGFSVPPETFADLQTALLTTLHDSSGTGSGGIDWTFSIQDKDLDFLGAGDTLTVTYDVAVNDAAASSTQQVTITITGAADQAIVNPLTTAVFDTAGQDAGQIVAVGNLIADAGDTGGDASNTLTIVDVNGHPVSGPISVAGTYGTLNVDADGSYSYVANSALDALQVGTNPTEQFNFTVTDSMGHNTSTTVTFNITGADDLARIGPSDTSATMTEDAGPTAVVNGGFETGDLTGWSTSGSHIHVSQLELGGNFGQYSALLSPTNIAETLSQSVATTPGQHDFLSFDVIGDPESGDSPLTVSWDGTTILSLGNVPAGVNHYTFDVTSDASLSHTALNFTYTDDSDGMIIDSVAVNPATGPATEFAAGTISFTDAETADTHTASFSPADAGYVGTFSLDPFTEASGASETFSSLTMPRWAVRFSTPARMASRPATRPPRP